MGGSITRTCSFFDIVALLLGSRRRSARHNVFLHIVFFYCILNRPTDLWCMTSWSCWRCLYGVAKIALSQIRRQAINLEPQRGINFKSREAVSPKSLANVKRVLKKPPSFTLLTRAHKRKATNIWIIHASGSPWPKAWHLEGGAEREVCCSWRTVVVARAAGTAADTSQLLVND